jgi:hypothetical protein
VLQPSENWLETFMTLTEDFIMQNMNVSREKCYMDPESGGLGLFRPDFFFKSLTCSWAIRCTTLGHDNWRRQLLNAGSAGLELLQKRDVEHLGPILTHIATNFIELRHDFGIIHNNFVFSPILNIPTLRTNYRAVKKFLTTISSITTLRDWKTQEKGPSAGAR